MASYGIAAFRSRQQVMYFQRRLEQAGITAEIINTPHEIAIGCGLSVKFSLEDYETVKRILEQNRPEAFVGFYYIDTQGVKLKCLPMYQYIE